MTDDTPRIAQLPDRERIARAIYETDPFCEGGEYVDGFQVSPGGALSWKQALDRDAEFADDKIMLPITKFAFDAADRVIAALAPGNAGAAEASKAERERIARIVFDHLPGDITWEDHTASHTLPFEIADAILAAPLPATQGDGE
jgi:hypothetical protein